MTAGQFIDEVRAASREAQIDLECVYFNDHTMTFHWSLGNYHFAWQMSHIDISDVRQARYDPAILAREQIAIARVELQAAFARGKGKSPVTA